MITVLPLAHHVVTLSSAVHYSRAFGPLVLYYISFLPKKEIPVEQAPLLKLTNAIRNTVYNIELNNK